MALEAPILNYVRFCYGHEKQKKEFLQWLDSSLRKVIENKNDPGEVIREKETNSPFPIYNDTKKTRKLIQDICSDLSLSSIPNENELGNIVDKKFLGKEKNIFNSNLSDLVSHILLNQLLLPIRSKLDSINNKMCEIKDSFSQFSHFSPRSVNFFQESELYDVIKNFISIDDSPSEDFQYLLSNFINAVEESKDIDQVQNCFLQASNNNEVKLLTLELHDFLINASTEDEFHSTLTQILAEQLYKHYKDFPQDYSKIADFWDDYNEEVISPDSFNYSYLNSTAQIYANRLGELIDNNRKK